MKFTKYFFLCSLLLTSCSSFEFLGGEEDSSVDFSAAEVSAPTDTLAGAGMGLLSSEMNKAKAATTPTNPQVAEGLQNKPQANARAGLGLFGAEQNSPQPAQAAEPIAPSKARTNASAGLGLFGMEEDSDQAITQDTTAPVSSSLLSNDKNQIVGKGVSNCFDLIWLVPTTSVHTYQIKFGTTESKLNGNVTLPIEMLTKAEHPQYGLVYQYQLLCNAAVDQLYISISAQNSFGDSNFSKVKKIGKK